MTETNATPQDENEQPQNPTEWIEWLQSEPEKRAIVVPWNKDSGCNVLAVHEGEIVESPGEHISAHQVPNPNARISWLNRDGQAKRAKVSDTRLSEVTQ